VTAIAVVAFGAVSSLGEGRAAVYAGDPGSIASVAIARDLELATAGLARPYAARALPGSAEHGVTALLMRALGACARDLDTVRPHWRGERVGLVLGTSSGGMRAAEAMFAAIERGEPIADAEAPTYFGPMASAARRLGLAFDPSILVLGACASGSLAIGLGKRWLERGSCDLVLAGGFDEVTVFVAAGFESLRATTASPPPRPFRAERDGMALGEGAAVLALARQGGGRARAFVSGFSATSDAVHLTAPERAGRGLAEAATRAMQEAGDPPIDFVSAHATATVLNDAAELRGLSSALGSARGRDTILHPFKAQIGHALGAAGALELLSAIDAIERGVLPAAAGDGPIDPEAPARLLTRSTAGNPKHVLKISSAFGGANAALVVSSEGDLRPLRSRGHAFLEGAVAIDREATAEELAARLRLPPERVARGDALVRLALTAVAELEAAHGPLKGAGIVVGTVLATIETNAAFAARLRQRGVAAAEPRRFPYTSPNAVCGECSIAFGLTGPAFAVGGGGHAALEALACGALLVEAGDADRVVVVAVDDVGPVTCELGGGNLGPGAVAALLTGRASPAARARIGAIALRRGPYRGHEAEDARGAALRGGHAAILPLTSRVLPTALECRPSPDVLARVVLEPV
jgi:3-oxoacyl-[acyl-carrier-protein] synthase-1/3-oxoacyl-[acyl-carrier-protein] synthase II